MKISKYFNIDKNILIEYIYDDSNVIGEPYNILYNNKTGLKSFISTEELRPPIKGYKRTNNDAYNQLYEVDTIEQKYSKLPILATNKISDDYTFLQLRNFSTSIPIRYDTIKIHIPINWVFDNYKGFYIRVYCYNFDNTKVIELSNFYFNITDIEQNYKLEYSSPLLYINEKQWGKYVSIQIPSVTKVSDQRKLNVTKSNSINYNLSDGLGLSKKSPIFIDFHFIETIDRINKIDYFNLSSKVSVVVPQTPEFEKLGIKIEESTQGDFFLIYGTYNGTIAEFQDFIEESYYEGNRYYVEYKVELFEKNIKTKTNTFPVTEDFGEEIEYRPIIKFSTTTAIIDVTMRLINNIDGTFIERKASYGLLQGGGAKMGSEFNSRLNIGIKNIGAGDISKYGRSLTKIELKKSIKKEIINIKSNVFLNTGKDAFGTKSILKLDKLPFNIFSSDYFFINSDKSVYRDNIEYKSNNQSILFIYPFDNILKINIIKDSENVYDLTTLENIKMIIKSDKKDILFDIYRDSSENSLEDGKIVFIIPIGQYQSIKKVFNMGFNIFYIVGIDENSLKSIIYSGYFIPWDSDLNINRLEDIFLNSNIEENSSLMAPIEEIIIEESPILNELEIIPKGVNTTTLDKPSILIIKNSGLSNSGFSFNFNPRWKSSSDAILLSNISIYDPNTLSKYKKPGDTRSLEIKLISLGFIKALKISDILKYREGTNNPGKKNIDSITDKISNNEALNIQKTSYLLGYFKGLNIEPNATNLDTFFNNSKIKTNLEDYVNSGITRSRVTNGIGLKEEDVTIGEYIPKDRKDFNFILSNKIVEQFSKKFRI